MSDLFPNTISPVGASLFTAEYASAQTATEIIAAPAAGSRIAVRGIKVSCDSAIKVSFHDEDDNILDVLHSAVDGMQIYTFTDEILLTAAKALEVTTVGAGNVFIGVFYRILT